MATQGGISKYLLECKLCKAKLTATGVVVGGDPNCNPHHYVPLTVVYPSELESSCIRSLSDIQEETQEHIRQFEQDATLLTTNLNEAKRRITEVMESLQDKLMIRKQEMEAKLLAAYQEREQLIHNNLQQLKQFAHQNQAVKDECDQLLANSGEDDICEREERIVSQCKQVLSCAPDLRYIHTDLRYSFHNVDLLSSRMDKLGILHIRSVDNGKPCTFATIDRRNNESSSLPNLEPQIVTIPELKLSTVLFNRDLQRVQITFRLNKKDKTKTKPKAKQKQKQENDKVTDGEPSEEQETESEEKQEYDELDIFKYLHIDVYCVDDEDIDDANSDNEVVYDGSISFSDCKHVRNRYVALLDHIFANGKTIVVKIRARFTSPNESQYISCNGEWSRVQAFQVPDIQSQSQSQSVQHMIAPPMIVVPPSPMAQDDDDNEHGSKYNYTVNSDNDNDNDSDMKQSTIPVRVPRRLEFWCMFNGQRKRMFINDDDACLSNFRMFENRFLSLFSLRLKPNETLLLRHKRTMLTEKSDLISFASEGVVIKGHVQRPRVQSRVAPPAAAYSTPGEGGNNNHNHNNNNNNNMPEGELQHVSFKNKPSRVGHNHNYNYNYKNQNQNPYPHPQQPVAIHRRRQQQHNNNNNNNNSHNNYNNRNNKQSKKIQDAPKQISAIASFEKGKKRVILKYSEKSNVYDYTMETLKQRLMHKFKPKLTEPFTVKTDKGDILRRDEDIVRCMTHKDPKLIVSK